VPAELSLRAPGVPASLDDVHALLLRAWDRHPDVGDDDRMRFEIAVVEIAGNVVEHAGDPDPVDFELAVRVEDDRLEARFQDPGRCVDVDFSTADMPDGLAETGRGVALALATADELTYRRVGAVNHWLVLRRRRP
jgi:serine/threonine-protein kinase RsbW